MGENRTFIDEFFGFGGFERPIEGYFSWQHILFVTILMVIMVTLAIYFGRKYNGKDLKTRNKVLIIAALLIDGFELFKILVYCINEASLDPLKQNLPLFLCSIQLITIPLAAFSKGRIKEASLDFVSIFGLLGAVLGTYLAGNNYSCYPVLSFPNVVSGITHSISGFSALYILISGSASMKKENMFISFSIMFAFAIMAYIANLALGTNYMFLVRGDGTPYDIIYNLVNGSKVFYPIIVVLLFVVYIYLFYYIYYLITSKKEKLS